MKLTTVGVSGSVPGPQSPASCYLFECTADEVAAAVAAGTIPSTTEVRDWKIVIELGNGSMGPLIAYICPKDIDALFLTHFHADHFSDITALYVHLRYHPQYGAVVTGQNNPLPVWGPTGLRERMARISNDLSGDLSVVDPHHLDVARPIQVGPFNIVVKTVFHTVEAYGLRITGPSSCTPGELKVIGYSGDTDYCAGVVELAHEVDLFLAEAGYRHNPNAMSGVHLSGVRAGQVATEAGARQLVITHIPPWNDPQATFAEAQTTYDGPTFLARSGSTFTL